ncbi:LuxR C-terminal-related transcriptional regulator [Sphingomonas sp. SUN019]|uniref:LuxR C-terminal-related transcriptional regulator n=1 Tax=Sphingomonas sp. SUN019 TaxID=2937788 RepID=UPI002164BD41|nr:LuxR C-terminal-related transcriptional regulator [Sphingomonas sp. SUN019]UVO50141.1 LuxR C-terminal-related transcriptional regulator [Sphingomonas sp. SUN019]
MDDSQLPLLAERHRKVLRLYRERFRLKEIARELSLSENSVNTYLTEAVQILGAPGRRAAADALARFEDPSRNSRYRPSVPEIPPELIVPPEPQRRDDAAKSDGFLPLRPIDGAPNSLPAHARLLWIVALLVTLVVGVAIAVAIYTVYVKPMERLLR